MSQSVSMRKQEMCIKLSWKKGHYLQIKFFYLTSYRTRNNLSSKMHTRLCSDLQYVAEKHMYTQMGEVTEYWGKTHADHLNNFFYKVLR
jgi:hypothetical protein